MTELTNMDNAAYLEKQANISVILIIAITIMVVVYMGCTYTSENDSLYQGAIIAPIITFLLGIYVFSYRGKGHLASRILFFVFLALSILGILALYYIIGLAKAFAH